MTHLRLAALGLFLAVILCFQPAHAQQTNSPNNDQAIADSIWSHDEKRARALFASVEHGQAGRLRQMGAISRLLANNAGYFAWYDFDRALNLAAQFERSEIRMMAQLKLAQGILAGPPKRLPGGTTLRF